MNAVILSSIESAEDVSHKYVTKLKEYEIGTVVLTRPSPHFVSGYATRQYGDARDSYMAELRQALRAHHELGARALLLVPDTTPVTNAVSREAWRRDIGLISMTAHVAGQEDGMNVFIHRLPRAADLDRSGMEPELTQDYWDALARMAIELDGDVTELTKV